LAVRLVDWWNARGLGFRALRQFLRGVVESLTEE
jgi:hypothetical protein